VAWELFGMEDVDERTWKDISAQLWKVSETGFYYRLLREHARIAMVLVDNVVDASTRTCCAQVAGYDRFLAPRTLADIERLTDSLDEESTISRDSLDELVERAVKRDLDQGVVAFKLGSLPPATEPSSEEVGWALGRVVRRGTPEAHDEPALQSYLVDRFLSCVLPSGQPVLVHVESAATVERLGVLARQHPGVPFVAIYAGGADPFTLGTLGRTLPNVLLAVGDLWRFAPSEARRALGIWLHAVALSKLFALAGNATMVEAVCAQSMIVREQIAILMTGMVADGYLDEGDAILCMEHLLYKNAVARFGLQ